VISSESGSAAAGKKGKGKSAGAAKWPTVPDYQLDFLTAQLQQIKASNYQGAVILAVHHPPFTYSPQQGGKTGGKHYGSPVMLAEIDTICKATGVYPHAFISGHAHNYQRYTRDVTFAGKKYSVPFVVCGDSGHNVDKMVHNSHGQVVPEPGENANVSYMDTNPVVQATGLTINHHDDSNFGFLRVSVTASTLTITFNPIPKPGGAPAKPDTVTVDLPSHTAS